jgi:mRNA interferase MazF
LVNKSTESAPKIGDIYLMNFGGSGSEQVGLRPGVVFQNNVGNSHSPNIIALPITSAVKKMGQPTHVFLSQSDTGLLRDSVVLCENPERMSKEKLGRFICRLSDDYMKRITEANLLATSAIAFLDIETLMKVWRKAAALNSVPA